VDCATKISRLYILARTCARARVCVCVLCVRVCVGLCVCVCVCVCVNFGSSNWTENIFKTVHSDLPSIHFNTSLQFTFAHSNNSFPLHECLPVASCPLQVSAAIERENSN
jgi:hypothetical protein